MNRRETVLALLALGAPGAPFAQQQGNLRRVGFLAARSRSTPSNPDTFYDAFTQGMRELGYVEGKNLVLEWRFAEGKNERIAGLAAELVQMKLEVIVTHYTPAIEALQRVTSTIPIVAASMADPIGSGFATSLAHPGKNITGLSNIPADLSAKQFELLRIMLPRLSRTAVLMNSDVSFHARTLKNLEVAARGLGVTVVPVNARTPDEIERGFARMKQENTDAVVILADSFFIGQRRQITNLAARGRLPSMFYYREDVEAGGLMSYGQNVAEFYRRAAIFVDKILKGAKPGELPIEQPTKIHLAINQKTAKALGLTISQELLLRADEVIE